MASLGTLPMVTDIIEFVCHTVATVIMSVWPSDWDAWWPVQASLGSSLPTLSAFLSCLKL